MENKKKNCPGCNKEFKLGRSDQIYCNKKCKSSYHNKNNTKNLEIVKKITNLLMKNYKLVLALMGDKKTIEVSGEYLRSIGFLFTFHRHV